MIYDQEMPEEREHVLHWVCEGCGRTWDVEMPGFPGTTLDGHHWHTVPSDPSGLNERCEGPMVATMLIETPA